MTVTLAQFNLAVMKLTIAILSVLSVVIFSVVVCSSISVPVTEIPRILFFGAGDWQLLLSIDPNPFVFISSLETNIKVQAETEGQIRFGLLLLDDEVQHLKQLPREKLNELIVNLKGTFYERTGTPLKYCAAEFKRGTKLEEVFLANGIISLYARAWSESREKNRDLKHLSVDLNDRSDLSEFLSSKGIHLTEASHSDSESD